MKALSSMILSQLICLVIALQLSCYSSSGRNNSVSGHPGQVSDQELLNQVEQFASSDETMSSKAWEALKLQDRTSLIEGLNRLSASSSKDDYHRILISFLLCNLDHQYDSNLQIVLSGLDRQLPFKRFHGDWAVALVNRLMVRGDQSLLKDLFAAAEWSDGAMSDELSHAYSQAILKDPQLFVITLKPLDYKARRRVYTFLLEAFRSEDSSKTESFLLSVNPRSDLYEVAQETLKVIRKKPN